MKAMLLAAGLGTRLRPLTDTSPKPLLPIVDRAVIDYQLAALARAGVEAVVINLHHHADQIRRHVGDGSAWGLRVRYSHEPELLGTGGGLARVKRFFEGEDAFPVLNADVAHTIPLAEAVSRHRASGDDATLIVCEHPGSPQIGWIGVDDAGRVVRVPDMPDEGSARRMFIGMHVLSPAIFDHLPDGLVGCILRNGYRGMLEAGRRVGTFETSPAAHHDIGTLGGYLAANFAALAQARGLPPLRPREGVVVRAPPVWISPQADIGAETTLGPWVVIGAGTSIGPRCVLERCLVLSGTRVAEGTSLREAIAWHSETLFPGGQRAAAE